MPSKAVGAAILDLVAWVRNELKDSAHDGPFSWPSFQERLSAIEPEDVCVTRAPWRSPEEGKKHIFGWSSPQVERAEAFVKAYCDISDAQSRREFLNEKSDDQSAGRELIRNGLSHAWEKQWQLSKLVRELMEEEGRGIYDVVALHGERKVSDDIFRSPSLTFILVFIVSKHGRGRYLRCSQCGSVQDIWSRWLEEIGTETNSSKRST